MTPPHFSTGVYILHRLPSIPWKDRKSGRLHRGAVHRMLALDRDALLVFDVPGVEVLPAYEWFLAPTNQ